MLDCRSVVFKWLIRFDHCFADLTFYFVELTMLSWAKLIFRFKQAVVWFLGKLL